MDFDFLQLFLVLGVILISMTVHEAMHAFIGYWLGDDTAQREGRLTLNPLKHIDPFLTILLPLGLFILGGPIFGGAKPVPFNPDRVKGGDWGAALVALGGPLTNLLFAFVAYGIWSILGGPAVTGIGAQVLILTITINLGFFIFNMLPIPPLDGSRVLYAIAPEFVRSGMRFIERYGLFVVFGLVLLFGGSIGALIGSVSDSIIDFFKLIFRN